MAPRLARVVLVAALALAVVAPARGQDAPLDGDGPLTALAFAPPGTRIIATTDWTRLKAAHGLEALTSAVPEDLRVRRMVDLARDEALFASFGLPHLVGHLDAWGWDATDLGWEAHLASDAGIVSVLRFRAGFDLARFIAHLDERGFDRRVRGDVIIRSHPLDLGADWITTTDFGILNLGFLPDGRTVVAARTPEALDATLAATEAVDAGALRASAVGRLATAMADATSTLMEIGPGTCLAYAPDPLDEAGAAGRALIESVGPLAPWDAMGVGAFRRADGGPEGRLLLIFPRLGSAAIAAEAMARGRLARQGVSRRTGAPYAESVFGLTSTTVDGPLVELVLEPVGGRSAVLTAAVFSRDLVPAMCG